MFIVTTKFSGRKLLCVAVALAAVALGVHVAGQMAGDVAALSVLGGSEAEQTSQQENVSTKVLDNEDRVNYLAACGWIADADSGTMQEVIIPSDFDETYQQYAQMQEQQGFHLEKYRGKKVKLATYPVVNTQEGVELEANLLIYRHRVIAGDITSLSEGGTAYGLMDTRLRQSEGSAEQSEKE